MTDEETFLLFTRKVPKELFEFFSFLYDVEVGTGDGKLTQLMRDVMYSLADGNSYQMTMKDLDKKYVGSIQNAEKSALKNIVQGFRDTVWLYKNPSVMEYIRDKYA